MLQIMENPDVHSPERPQRRTLKPMNAITPSKAKRAGKGEALGLPVFQAPRMRGPLRAAILHMVETGCSQRQAAIHAGMNETALGRALRKPAIAGWKQSLEAQYALDAEQLKGRAKAIAIHAGIDLLHNAQSEAVRARMVELFAGEAKAGTQVNVNIGAKASGYEYLRPGARVIEIRAGDDGPQDTASSGEIGQDLDNIDDAETVDPTNDPTD